VNVVYSEKEPDKLSPPSREMIGREEDDNGMMGIGFFCICIFSLFVSLPEM